MDTAVLISLVVPVFNEGRHIRSNLAAMLAAVDGIGLPVELVAVDDGSADDSIAQIEALQHSESRIELIALTRNFGKEAAIFAGLEHAQGDAVIVLDADLQHPPSLIPAMIQAWQEGAEVVEAVKRERGDASPLDALFAKSFYALYRRLSGFDIDGHSDFKLLDRSIVDVYLRLPERYRFFRGLVNWLGIESTRITFDVAQRAEGGSRWHRLALLRYAINNVTAFSTIPLAIVTWLGIVTLGIGFVLGVVTLWQKATGTAESGFTTINILVILMGGSIMTSLGIIGHYIGLIYHEVKARPIYIRKLPRRRDG